MSPAENKKKKKTVELVCGWAGSAGIMQNINYTPRNVQRRPRQ